MMCTCMKVSLASVCNRCKNGSNDGQGHKWAHVFWQWFPHCVTVAQQPGINGHKHTHTHNVCPVHQGGQREPGGQLTVCLNKVNTQVHMHVRTHTRMYCILHEDCIWTYQGGPCLIFPILSTPTISLMYAHRTHTVTYSYAQINVSVCFLAMCLA